MQSSARDKNGVIHRSLGDDVLLLCAGVCLLQPLAPVMTKRPAFRQRVCSKNLPFVAGTMSATWQKNFIWMRKRNFFYTCRKAVHLQLAMTYLPPLGNCFQTIQLAQRWETGPHKDRPGGTEGIRQFPGKVWVRE